MNLTHTTYCVRYELGYEGQNADPIDLYLYTNDPHEAIEGWELYNKSINSNTELVEELQEEWVGNADFYAKNHTASVMKGQLPLLKEPNHSYELVGGVFS